MTKNEFITEVFKKYAFVPDEDIYKMDRGGKKTAIITKVGIQKIIKAEQLTYKFREVVVLPDFCAVECTIYKDNKNIGSSYGSAEGSNVTNKQKYYLEMAEKRAKARAILMAIDAHGMLYSEDEAEDFKKQPEDAKQI
jgi:hypothetical protein